MLLIFKRNPEMPADFRYVIFKDLNGKAFAGYYSYGLFRAAILQAPKEDSKTIQHPGDVCLMKSQVSEWCYVE